jgi:hypothetical protein
MIRKELARKIEHHASELQALIARADDVLQSDDMPEPYDQWQGAVDAAQDAWLDLQHSGYFGARVTLVSEALRKAGG